MYMHVYQKINKLGNVFADIAFGFAVPWWSFSASIKGRWILALFLCIKKWNSSHQLQCKISQA